MLNRPREPEKSFIQSFCSNAGSLLTLNPHYMQTQAMREGLRRFIKPAIHNLFFYYLTPEEFVGVFPEGTGFKELQIETVAVQGLSVENIKTLFSNLPVSVQTVAIEDLENQALSFIYNACKNAGRTIKVICGSQIPPRWRTRFTEMWQPGARSPYSKASLPPEKKRKRADSSSSDEVSSDKNTDSNSPSSSGSDEENSAKKKSSGSSSKKIIADLKEKLAKANTKGNRLEREQTKKNRELKEYQEEINRLEGELAAAKQKISEQEIAVRIAAWPTSIMAAKVEVSPLPAYSEYHSWPAPIKTEEQSSAQNFKYATQPAEGDQAAKASKINPYSHAPRQSLWSHQTPSAELPFIARKIGQVAYAVGIGDTGLLSQPPESKSTFPSSHLEPYLAKPFRY
jgi:hypothetical protein